MSETIIVPQDGSYAITLQRLVNGVAGTPGVDFRAYSQIRSAGGKLLATCAITNDAASKAFVVSLTYAEVRQLPVGRHRQNVVYVLPGAIRDASPWWNVQVDPLTTEVPANG